MLKNSYKDRGFTAEGLLSCSLTVLLPLNVRHYISPSFTSLLLHYKRLMEQLDLPVWFRLLSSPVLSCWSILYFFCLDKKRNPVLFSVSTLTQHVILLARLWHCLFKVIIFQQSSCCTSLLVLNCSWSINFLWLRCLLSLMYSLQTDSYAY